MLDKFPKSTILKYAYGGFLLVGIIAYIDHSILAASIAAMGPVVTPLVIFFLGTCIYVVYRYIIGELFLYPITHSLMYLISKQYFKFEEHLSPTSYLGKAGVQFTQRRAAYSEIRRDYLEEKDRERFDFAHSAIHILYITAIELGVTGVFAPNAGGLTLSNYFLMGSILSLCSAIIIDIQQHRIEYKHLRSTPEEETKEFLKKKGYLKLR